MTFKSTRVRSGLYYVTNGKRQVTVENIQLSDGWCWMASADWDRFQFTDPLTTKREAMEAALGMLKNT